MTKYVVVSDRVVGAEPDDLIDDLPGVNMAALVQAGHVKPAPKPATTKKKEG